jgi:glutaconate CoA-transferase subunit B
VTPPGVYRRGGPSDLVTNLAHFTFDRQVGRFTLRSVHQGHSLDEIVENTGFTFDRSAVVAESPALSPEWLQLLRGKVRDQVAETYPKFAATLGAD